MTEVTILNERYALESQAGAGGMAITYRARDLQLNRTVAVKIMRDQFILDPQNIERFRREAQIAARISHENIAAVYDTGKAEGRYYIVMEFVEGTDLKQRLRAEGTLSILNALEIARQVAAALDAAHRGGLIHRDIKPHNILLNQDGKVKVTDFGIAKLTSEGEDTGQIMGSVHYISPEQARGEATTPSSDIYSLGAVLYEMLTGSTLFKAENAMAVAHKQIYERPPLPRTARPEIPPEVEALVLTCLEKDPRARFQSAAELQARLAQLINQLSQEDTIIIAAPPEDGTQIIRPVPPPLPKNPLPTNSNASTMPPSETPYHTTDAKLYQYPSTTTNGNKGVWITTLIIVLALTAGVLIYAMLGGFAPPPPTNNSNMITMPDLLNMEQKTAQDTLERLGLIVEIKEEVHPESASGLVFDQRPLAGATLAAKSKVTLWVSTGAPVITVPNMSGQTLDEAKMTLENAGFKGTVLHREDNSDLPKGQVIRSNPFAGASLKESGKIYLVLSNGLSPKVEESFSGFIVPDIGEPQVLVRVELENPVGAEPEVVGEWTLSSGETVPEVTFSRLASDEAIIRVLAGKDERTLEKYGDDQHYGPGAEPTQ